MTRPMRHGNLEDGFCEIDGDGRMLHVDFSKEINERRSDRIRMQSYIRPIGEA
jgi:hypothetical protein